VVPIRVAQFLARNEEEIQDVIFDGEIVTTK
jgi:hypothetical protein